MHELKLPSITIKLPASTPPRLREIVAAVPGVEPGTAHDPSLHVHGHSYPVFLLMGGLRPFAHATAPLLSQVQPGHVALVLAERLPATVRKQLEAAGCSYIDGAGAAHLVAPGLFLHIEAQRRRRVVPAPPGLGVVGVRVLQTLLDGRTDHRIWTVAGLAEAAAVSVGEAHRVLRRLEDEDLVRANGRARNRRRQVVNPGDLLDWVARVPSARRIHASLHAFLYASTPEQLVRKLGQTFDEAGIRYALTGSAAAVRFGIPAATSLPVVMVRIDPGRELEAVVAALEAEVVDEGSNLLLVADVGQLGIHGSQPIAAVQVAPPSRIWLDILGERRGEAIGDLFREAVLGY